MVFTKAGPEQGWLLAHDGLAWLDLATTPGWTDRAGFVPAASTLPAAQRDRARSAAGQLAAAWQETKRTGTVPSGTPFRLSGQTLQRMQGLAAHRDGTVQGGAEVGRYTFFVSATDPLFELPVPGGYELACHAVRERVVYSGTFLHPVGQDPARRSWGRSLRPGNYRQVVSRDAWQTCFVVPPDAAEPITVLNQYAPGSLVTPS